MNMNFSKKLIGYIFAGIVCAGSFLVVFGSSLKNLENNIEEVKEIENVVEPKKEDKKINTATSPKPATTTTTTNTSTPPQTTNTNIPPTPTPSGFTLSDVSLHNSANSCWSAINGEVYDFTSWVNKHPGGKAAILMICGKDGSPLFNAQHGNSKKIANILKSYDIGQLKS